MVEDESASSPGMGNHGTTLPDLKPKPPPESSPAPSAGSSQSRPHYTPQFSATTQMILQRIRGEPSSLSSPLPPAAAAGVFKQASYEDAKRRLVMSMNTSLTLPMPAPQTASPGQTPNTIQLPKIAPRPHVAATPSIPSAPSSTSKGPTGRGPGRPRKPDHQLKQPRKLNKRKRVKLEEDVSTPISATPESEEDEYQDPNAQTMTKSGRQILKPTQFNPATAPAPPKRKHYGKRTPEQALCKVCTRGLSPEKNQIVFCDGCNFCWHQLCHDPFIEDELLGDESRSWFCRTCMSKREKHLAKKKSVDGFKGVSWAFKSADQKRAYLSALSQTQLVSLVMYSVEIHPDLPLFPASEGAVAKRGPRNGFTSGPISFSRSLSTPDARSPAGARENGKRSNGKTSTDVMDQTVRESSVESVPPAWPKAGQGVLAGLKMDEDDFEDKNDFESFSVATYNAAGKKISENGMPVSSQENAD